MKKILTSLLITCSLPAFGADAVYPTSKGSYIIIDSSQRKPGDTGSKMHTNIVLFKPNQLQANGLPGGETPASIACVYGLTPQVPGCPISGTSILPNTGWGAIGIVDAYDNPYAESDLNTFSAAFKLPACTTANNCFQKVYAAGSAPPYSEGWADEHVLDIEWAHAMAPNAKIILVEAASGSTADLMQAVQVAGTLVAAAGGGVVSNSWGSPEFAGENAYDSNFIKPGVVFVASSGDYSAPATYPSSSPNVVSAGGTTIIRDQNGNLINETGWNTNPNVPIGSKSGGSGGPSQYEPRPAYQNWVAKMVGPMRGTPDISFDADPHSGVDVYSTAHGGWLIDGGTSVSAPSLAGIINSANSRAKSTNEELNLIYKNAVKNYHSYWHDILSGNNGFPALSGYDFVTGLGSPLSYAGK
ncbi:MAG: S53 family peptidase [Gammaproteobacteria bacterium]|nr:S53 family peptidase [Gammaproteobacteria bacterium]